MSHRSAAVPDHPIAALATAYAKSPIAVIRVSGADCLDLLRPLLYVQKKFQDQPVPLQNLEPRKVTRCCVIHNGQIIDECLITAFKAPQSYTGEDAAEISIHGSIAGIERILCCLRSAGFSDAQPGEFTRRAFLRGKIDLTQAEAVHDIIEAHSAQEHERAVHQLSRALSSEINIIKQKIAQLAAVCAVCLDYPDDEIQENTDLPAEKIDEIIQSLQHLADSYSFITLQRQGAKIVLGGRTNAGKSSLFNALLKKERALVSSEHGTTRDYLECSMNMREIPVTVFDTAGLRETSQAVENLGMQKSYTLLLSAQAVLYIVDSAAGWTDEDSCIFEYLQQQNNNAAFIVVWNKIDALTGPDSDIPRITNNYNSKICSRHSSASAAKTYRVSL